MATVRNTESFRRVLRDMDFPASKGDVIDRLEQEGADAEVLSALQAIPQAEYYDEDQVLRSIPIGTATEGRSETGRDHDE